MHYIILLNYSIKDIYNIHYIQNTELSFHILKFILIKCFGVKYKMIHI